MAVEQTDWIVDAAEMDPQGSTDGHHDETREISDATAQCDPTVEIPPAEQQVDEPPDGGYGWVCVLCVFLINGHTWGINSVSPSITGRQQSKY